MTSDAPEFYTKPTTPLSPLPFHPPEPSNIPVLRNQIDPIFNMTSTHLNTSDVDMTQAADDASNRSISNDSSEDNDDSGFSDTFDKDDRRADDAAKDTTAQQDAEVDDDFAKTFDSDGEGSSSKQDEIATTHVEQIQCPPAPLSSAADHTAHAAPVSSSSHVLSGGAEPTAFHDALPHTTAGDASVATYSIAAPVATETQQPQTLPLSYEAVSNGEIDIQQLLDNITANAALNAPSATNAPQTPPTFSNANLSQGTAGLPAHASLPPRPQVTQNPATAQGYTAHDDMRKYHAGPPGFQPPPNSTYRPLGAPPAISAAGAPGTASDPLNALPPPPLASFHPPAGAGPIPPPPFGFVPFAEGNRLPSKEPPASASAASQSDDDHSWNPAVKKLYDEFLADERMYVSEGLWDRFPVGSRLFIGNLPSELVTKRDIFNAFYRYGRLAQISIKQAYGFVQFHTVAECQNALRQEQGAELRGRKMHLEISKPQKNSRNANAANSRNSTHDSVRRSRSPDHIRGGVDRAIRGGQTITRNDGYDRYSGSSQRDGEFRRGRDDYRPGRSPSPPRGGYRTRDEYGAARSWDHDGRRRSRSRSPPYGRRDNGRYRDRSPSPRRGPDEDELPIPHRDPRDVPDVQIIVVEELDRSFVQWVDGTLQKRGIKTHVMLLGPRLPIAAVIRRQILEGVLAVVQLTLRSQGSSKIPLQVFDRSGGANNVRFDEYQDLDPNIVAELVLREKQKQVVPVPQAYGLPQMAMPQPYQQAAPNVPPPTMAPNLGNLVGQLDNATLQKLLGTLTAAPAAPQAQSAPGAGQPIDLAGILGGLMQQQQQQQPQQPNMYQPPIQQANGYGAVPTGDLASIISQAGSQSQAQGQSAQQVQNIMAQLARFRQ